MTAAEINDQIKALTVPRAGTFDEPVTVGGWYRTTLETGDLLTKVEWTNGRLCEGITIRAVDRERYESLNDAGQEAFDRE